ncbi:MAG: cytochrome c biogenesis CcdA family protein [Hyphomicrobiales bacterium]
MNIPITTAFLAGLLSFLSPCVLPLAPPYLCFLAGASLEELGHGQDISRQILHRRLLLRALWFVLGFSTVFIALGVTASLVGQILRANQTLLSQIAGAIIILMGLHLLGAFELNLLNRDGRYHHKNTPGGVFAAYLVGLAFAFGWTPCIGPVLAAILAMAAGEKSATGGGAMLAVYSAGLGVPWMIAALAMEPFIGFMRHMRRYVGIVRRVTGGLLVITGLMFLADMMKSVSYWLLQTFPILARIG